MKIVQTLSSISLRAAGPSYSVPRLAEALAESGQTVELLTLGDSNSQRMNNGVLVKHFYRQFAGVSAISRMGVSRTLKDGLAIAAAEADIVHSHGLWMLPNIYASKAAVQAATPLVVSPRGMLDPAAMSFSPLKKRLFWRIAQRQAVLAAACIHATSEKEYVDVRSYGVRCPVAIIANGVDVPVEPRLRANSCNHTVLSLGRIHPKKGLDVLIDAWAKVEPRFPLWRLRIVGPSEGGHDGELKKLIAKLRLARVTIEEGVYGAGKFELLATSDLFVMSSKGENFGMTVAESLGAGTPVIATNTTPWAGLLDYRCGWWIEGSVDSIAKALCEAMMMSPYDRGEMGRRGSRWMQSSFSWRSIAADMLAVYRWLASSGPRPACVLVD